MYTFPMRQISYQATRTKRAKGDICAKIYLINVCQDSTQDIVPEIGAALGVALEAALGAALPWGSLQGSLLGQPFGVAFRGRLSG